MNLYEIRRSDFNPIAITIFIVLIGLGMIFPPSRVPRVKPLI